MAHNIPLVTHLEEPLAAGSVAPLGDMVYTFPALQGHCMAMMYRTIFWP